MAIILGIDPGLNNTGLGIIDFTNNKLSFIACKTIASKQTLSLVEKIINLNNSLEEYLASYKIDEVAIEQTFVNVNPLTSLNLGQARGAIILAVAQKNIPIFEYSSTKVKKAVSSAGRASKQQVAGMIKFFLPKATVDSEHTADALAVAICHANHSHIKNYLAKNNSVIK